MLGKTRAEESPPRQLPQDQDRDRDDEQVLRLEGSMRDFGELLSVPGDGELDELE